MIRKIIVFSACISFISLSAKQQQTSKQRGASLYKKYCLTCHQADGGGVPRMNPPLTQTSYVTGDKEKLIKWVLQGSVNQHVDIDGESYSNNMPAQNYLTDQQIADVLTYVRGSFGNKSSAVLPTEVKAIRASLGTKP
jgi:mono/diheme cytochrome c family protein